jgi:hypothetical protein
MIYAWIERLAWPVALAGAIFFSGMFYGKYLAASDAARLAKKQAEAKAEEVKAVDAIVTEYVDRIIEREVVVYVPNDSDCKSITDDFRLFFNRAATDKGLPEAP